MLVQGKNYGKKNVTAQARVTLQFIFLNKVEHVYTQTLCFPNRRFSYRLQ
jgi:hypothetical protein